MSHKGISEAVPAQNKRATPKCMCVRLSIPQGGGSLQSFVQGSSVPCPELKPSPAIDVSFRPKISPQGFKRFRSGKSNCPGATDIYVNFHKKILRNSKTSRHPDYLPLGLRG